MELSLRLAAVARLVPACRVMADIGTDHAYLPLFLAESGKAERCYACDVRPGPLGRARKNIAAAGLSDRVQTVLSDGLEALPETVDVLVLAGMGGRLMKSLLSSEKGTAPGIMAGLSDLILQPQSELNELWTFLPELGFRVTEEMAVFDRGKFYFVWHAVKAEGQDLPASFGRTLAERRDGVYRDYLEAELIKKEKLLQSLRKKNRDSVQERVEELEREKNALSEELNVFYEAVLPKS